MIAEARAVALTAIATLMMGGCSSEKAAQDAAPAQDAAHAAPYVITALDNARISSQSEDTYHRTAQVEIDFRDGPFVSAVLTLDLGTTCFPFEGWQDDPPPAGHNWPESCDAFDRLFEVSLLPVDGSDRPGIELVRAVTPFGGPMHITVDVTDIANAMPGKHLFEAFISTSYDKDGRVSGAKGGWNLSARVDVVPGDPPRNVLAVVPLYRHKHDHEMLQQTATFEVPDGTTMGRVEYRVTGHGGGAVGPNCIGPAEEFCRRQHTVILDNTTLAEMTPWRTDCADFCTIARYEGGSNGFNYCSQNPTGAISSVRAPRAGWCPGAVSDPQVWEIASLTPGIHSFAYSIADIAEKGSWRVSATFFAYGE